MRNIKDRNGMEVKNGDIIRINVNYGLYGFEAYSLDDFLVERDDVDGIRLRRIEDGEYPIDKSWIEDGEVIKRQSHD